MSTADTKALLQSIGANLRRLRMKSGMTQEALAERAGLEARFTQRVERGRIDIAMSTLVRLAKALQVPPAALLKPGKLSPPKPGRPRRRPSTGRSLS